VRKLEKKRVLAKPEGEPSFVREFKESSSQYRIPEKEDSEAISSNGEFDAARKAVIFEEDDSTELLLCEVKRLWK